MTYDDIQDNYHLMRCLHRINEEESYWDVYLISGKDTIKVPSEYDGIPVGTFDFSSQQNPYVEEWATANLKNIKAIILPNTIRKVYGDNETGNRAFTLKKLELPEGVEEIGEGFAIYSVDTLIIPSTVKKIGSGFFSKNPDGSGFHKALQLKSVELRGDNISFGDRCFYEAYKLTRIIFPKHQEIIPNYFCSSPIENEFYNRVRILDFKLPSTVKKIGDYCFDYINIENDENDAVMISEELEVIGKNCFRFILRDSEYGIQFPRTLREIKSPNIFKNGIVKIPNNTIRYIPDDFLSRRMLDSIIVPKGVEKIGKNAYSGLEPYLKQTQLIYLPSTLDTIDVGAFYLCGGARGVFCAAKTPPILLEEDFEDNFNPYRNIANKTHSFNCSFNLDLYKSADTLFVPEASIPLYMEAPLWKHFVIRSLESNPSYDEDKIWPPMPGEENDEDKSATFTKPVYTIDYNSPAEYLDIMGRSVGNKQPQQPGIYIERHGNTSKKIMVR